MKVFVILLVLVVLVIGTNASFAQYIGQIESYEFFIYHEGQHEINLQSSTTKFNDVFYDESVGAIIISVDSDNSVIDIISIRMNDTSFRALLADGKDVEPSDALVLLDGEEQEYHTPLIIKGNVVWQFKNKPNTTEIELILEPERYRDNKKQDNDFKYPVPRGGIIAENYPVKQQYEMGLKFENLKCNEGLILIQKYDGTPACVTESTKQKLIERGWTESLPPCTSDRTACFNQESNMCDPSGWDCGNEEVFSKVIPMPEPVYVIFPQNATGNSPDSGVIPHVSVITLEINDTITWINDSDITVILRAKDNSWNAGKILPQGKIDVKFNHTGQYEYLIDILKDKRRSGGEVIVLGENMDSISLDERLRMAQAILGQHFRELSIVSVGVGNADKILDVTIHEDELEKHQDAESYYKNTVEQIIPFDVPIRIDFGRYATPN